MYTIRTRSVGFVFAGCVLAMLSGADAGAAAVVRSAHSSSPYSVSTRSGRASNYYLLHWGVDSLTVRAVPADQLIRFSYRVVDAGKAKALGSKPASPELVDEKSRVSLVVPVMDKVGALRQSGPPENGKTYWMVFSNKGNVVKKGHRVGVVIGEFRARGLVVE